MDNPFAQRKNKLLTTDARSADHMFMFVSHGSYYVLCEVFRLLALSSFRRTEE